MNTEPSSSRRKATRPQLTLADRQSPEQVADLPPSSSSDEEESNSNTTPDLPDSTMATKPTELKISTPSFFDGNTNDAAQWMYSVIAYIDLNEEVYTNNNKKIIAALSFMNKGTAGSWAEAYYETATTSGWGNLG
ncbi:hypothetical protein PAXRUDRAFT_16482 [Paxillus rubicundulus Ve08.2h10]|uniref:DUF4939 domain-containing protein n=1 Tax=Paxillus rubicundulus Ve08.2h10 TaxID=930991 RepID=A0A0D0C879_9AGAM|nr:hypothetical protein PAXRUDRAFT_16482 [Paxillus rubicundulus Ve08.2h10]